MVLKYDIEAAQAGRKTLMALMIIKVYKQKKGPTN
tara:strand:+ start:3849 stop:3953 length:105 start_codon:yes stop_codon:yes gene_type:complete